MSCQRAKLSQSKSMILLPQEIMRNAQPQFHRGTMWHHKKEDTTLLAAQHCRGKHTMSAPYLHGLIRLPKYLGPKPWHDNVIFIATGITNLLQVKQQKKGRITNGSMESSHAAKAARIMHNMKTTVKDPALVHGLSFFPDTNQLCIPKN